MALSHIGVVLSLIELDRYTTIQEEEQLTGLMQNRALDSNDHIKEKEKEESWSIAEITEGISSAGRHVDPNRQAAWRPPKQANN